MRTKNAPGQLELIILKELQLLKEATVANIEHSLKHVYAYTTILTVLTRIYKKKLIERKKIGKQYVYFINENVSPTSVLARIKTALFGNNTSAMIQYLLETSDKISPTEMAKIESLVQRYKK